MTDSTLEKIFEHNNWANLKIIQACSTLSDDQLDAEPNLGTYGTIRQTLLHFVRSQQGYLRLLTVPVEERRQHPIKMEFDQLEQSVRTSGEALLNLVRSWTGEASVARLETTDGFHVEPWVVVVQIINHATEHREQIKGMLTTLGITPPEVDGWGYALDTQAMIPGAS